MRAVSRLGAVVADDEPDSVVELGGELAAAEAAERRHVSPGPSPIAHLRYPRETAALWRWTDRPEDDQIGAFVAGYSTADDVARARTRASLTMDDLYTILSYARRRALNAVRTGDRDMVAAAFDALATVEIERVDWRDVSVAAMLATYAAGHTGTGAAEAVAGAVRRAEPQVAEALAEIVQDGEVDLAEECGCRLVDTPGGLVLFDDDLEAYAPRRDLVRPALAVAAAIEADGTYHADITIGTELPPVWVGGESDDRVAAALAGLTGCLSIQGEHASGAADDFLLTFVAEAASADDAALLVAAADRLPRERSVAAGVADGDLCVIVIAASAGAGGQTAETPETLARFLPTAIHG